MGSFARRDWRTVIPDLVGGLFPYLVANLDRPGGLLSDDQQSLAIARTLAAAADILKKAGRLLPAV